MKNIGLIVNEAKDPSAQYTRAVIDLLTNNGFSVHIQTQNCAISDIPVVQGDLFYEQSDAIVTLGGDGTILSIAENAALYSKPIVGINLGHLGYLAQLEKHEISSLIPILNHIDSIEDRFMLCLTIHYHDGSICRHYALNDITLSRQVVFNTLNVSMYANDEFVFHFRSDGLVFATPTGSTAYSMSAGGPIADCNIRDIIIVTPVCEHSLFSKSMIFSSDDILSCYVETERQNSFVIVDGRIVDSFENIKTLTISKSPHYLKLLKTEGKRFYRVLNHKFGDGRVMPDETIATKNNN